MEYLLSQIHFSDFYFIIFLIYKIVHICIHLYTYMYIYIYYKTILIFHLIKCEI